MTERAQIVDPEPAMAAEFFGLLTCGLFKVSHCGGNLGLGQCDRLAGDPCFQSGTILGRRGPAQAIFTTLDNNELKRTSGLSGIGNEVRAMRDSTKSKLAAISTATLTTVLFKRGLRNTFIANVHRIQSGDVPNMVGPAYTLRYIPAREDLDHIGVFEDRSHPQRKGVEEC